MSANNLAALALATASPEPNDNIKLSRKERRELERKMKKEQRKNRKEDDGQPITWDEVNELINDCHKALSDIEERCVPIAEEALAIASDKHYMEVTVKQFKDDLVLLRNRLNDLDETHKDIRGLTGETDINTIMNALSVAMEYKEWFDGIFHGIAPAFDIICDVHYQEMRRLAVEEGKDPDEIIRLSLNG